MVTSDKIDDIHDLIGSIEGYGRNRLTAELEARTPEERDVVYATINAYSDQLRTLNPEERIQLTNRVIMGLEHVDKGKPRDLGTYLEVVCFNQPLEANHIERPNQRRTTTERKFDGATDQSYLDGTDPEEDE